MAKQTTILVVDDEKTIREVVRRYLELEGFNVLEAETGTHALALLRDTQPDLIVLDIMLPGIDGFAITRKLRNPSDYAPLSTNGDVPIIFLTARTDEADRLHGFEIGGDDYLVKPFSPRELVARAKAVMRRSGTGTGVIETPLTFDKLHLDPRSRTVTLDNQPVMLTAKEFDLLWFWHAIRAKCLVGCNCWIMCGAMNFLVTKAP